MERLIAASVAIQPVSSVQVQELKKPSKRRFLRHCPACQTAFAAIAGVRPSLTPGLFR
jgi:hypothetical protein